jgi:hypothetical protein
MPLERYLIFGSYMRLGELVPHDCGELDAHADVHLIVFDRESCCRGTICRRNRLPARPSASMMRSAVRSSLPSRVLHLSLWALRSMSVTAVSVYMVIRSARQAINLPIISKVAVGAEVLELRLRHVQVVFERQALELVVRHKALGRRAERHKDRVGLLDVA